MTRSRVADSAALIVLLLSISQNPAAAQQVPNSGASMVPNAAPSSGGTVELTINETPVVGSTPGQVLYSDGTLVQASPVTTDSSGDLTIPGALRLLGTSTGYTTVGTANASATNYTATLPAATDTIVELTQTQTLTNKSLTSPTLTGTVTLPDSSTVTTSGLLGSVQHTITGTVTPTMAAGTLALAGIITAPTFGANGEGAIYLSATNGFVLQGQGSTNDVVLVNKSGSIVCNITTGTLTINCNGNMQSQRFSVTAGTVPTNGIYLPAANTVGISANSTLSQSWTSTETIFAFPARMKGYTVGTLPAANAGDIAYVTDQTTTCAVTGAALVGGGAVTCPVFYNGSAWVGG